ncbi:redox-regulated ATPase YchF [Halococcoides cellulosivorans]|uniref:Redox-regulated ATPase YchF n=1 Tax=Halococcoides cellulosivorans TaxID=1679096 RepID=A0A2R4X2E0_9EURY|nr:redox-regulated ATPase YchF [Halococcoides cellulosivorans]AWB27883.1 redox-regulated ATPase YchF [Halococcoides cellulosivorans]
MITVALAGKPNAGKSTFYEAATRADVDVGNYPFTTIDPNRGVSYARTDCPCLDRAARCDSDNCRDGTRYVPVELLDVAGLVPGAHEGRGLGNQFLDALTDADVILHVVDASGATNSEGEPVEPGSHDPVDDVDFVAEELDRWLASVVADNWEGIERQARSPDFDFEDALTEFCTGIGATATDVARILRGMEYDPDPIAWTDADRRDLAREIRARTKPMVVVANKADAADPETLDRLADAAERVVPASAESERALRRAAEADLIDYDPGDATFDILGDPAAQQRDALDEIAALLDEYGSTGVQRALDTAVYDVLERITVYPVQNASDWTDGDGRVLPDAHLLSDDATPVDLAYAVHSDIGDGYLHAIDAREDRKISDETVLEEGDVIAIVSTA